MKKRRTYLLAFIFLIFAFNVNAQKIPNIQKESLRAPAVVKVDGKPSEWGSKLQAYNDATELFYTLANDNDNLYLVVQASDQDIVNKIVGGGITLSIQSSEKKSDNDGKSISVTYPILDKRTSLNFNLKKGIVTDTTSKIADSVMTANNKRIEKLCKWIVTTGITGLDTLSIYNEDSIKAAAAFDNRRIYTFELSISLKKLGFLQNNSVSFNYHITVNGLKTRGVSLRIPDNATPEMVAQAQRLMAPVITQNLRLTAPTDFWGKYTVTK